ncbi:hypothetical protein [Streptomyces sp. NPDC002078]
MKINRFRPTNRFLDMTVFLAILATGTLLTFLHVPAETLATIATALSGLYRTWTSARHFTPPPVGPPPDDSNRPAPTDPADTTGIKQPVG